jgi:triosephosphate isomerase
MNRRKPLIAGNWKMNGSRNANATLVSEVIAGAAASPDVELLICPPAVYLQDIAARIGTAAVALGAQTLSEQSGSGAFTGELSGAMLAEAGCRYVIVGHSERRSLYGETDVIVVKKIAAALSAKLIPILCVGETLEERESGAMESVLKRQLAAILDTLPVAELATLVVAYEPVWAIGTGLTASPAQAQAVHALLRSEISARDAKLSGSTRLLYGGSVKADNAAALFECEDIDGGLIGGASLKSAEFLAIAQAAQAAST